MPSSSLNRSTPKSVARSSPRSICAMRCCRPC
jgi:hypothetical protein